MSRKAEASVSLPGLNVQVPWCDLILSGKKTVETRKYPCPKKYLSKPVLLVETPGKNGVFKARIVGIAWFKETFQYRDQKHFERDVKLHRVDEASDFSWSNQPNRWGWRIEKSAKLAKPIAAPAKRGF